MLQPPQSKPSAVPVEACRFAADVMLGAVASDNPLAPAAVTVKARSNQPIEHWYWGKIVHDMSGMFTAGPVVPFDYNHNESEILGPCTKQEATPEGLIASGKLVPYVAGDRASEVIFKGGHADPELRVPYQASINWHGEGILIEQVGEGAIAQVNGYQFQGPGVIVRKWPLRGVAICPYGADANTETLFKEGGPTVPVHYVAEARSLPAAADDSKQFSRGDNLARIAAGIKFPGRAASAQQFADALSSTPATTPAVDDNHARITAGMKLPGPQATPRKFAAAPSSKTETTTPAADDNFAKVAKGMRFPGK